MVDRRPVIWAFAGMTQEWPQMGKALMEVPVFKGTVERFHKILKEKDESINLIHILTTEDKTIFEKLINPFIAITTMQIGFINIMKCLDLKPDYILGHSLGEIACGYADGCLTEEQAILCAYYRGLVTKNGKVKGRMAVVFMSAKELELILPEGVENGCHNTPNMCTITGNEDAVEKFLLSLDESTKNQNKIMRTSNTPYHSSLIKHLGVELEDYLKKVIPNPKKRSEKWYSSSVSSEDWDKEGNRSCSAEYFVNNYTGVVYFAEVCKLLPQKNILLDMSPSGIYSSVAEQNFQDSLCVSLAKKYNLDGMRILITKLRELKKQGIDFDLNKLGVDLKKFED
ncbi:hypothetical protein ACFFRR_005987 [Megaselia abdita]